MGENFSKNYWTKDSYLIELFLSEMKFLATYLRIKAEINEK